MAALLNYDIDNLEVGKLSKEEADQVLYYIELVLDEEIDIKKIISLMNLKAQIAKHREFLDSSML